MTRALVLYHSLYGNTKALAMSLASGIVEFGIETDCLTIDEIDMQQIPNYDFLAIGSPTHMIRPSKEMKGFLKRLRSIDLEGMKGFAFDTRNHSRMNKKSWLIFENSASRVIEAILKRKKVEIIRTRQSAIVHGREGPLDLGVKDTFADIGKEIGKSISQS